MWSGRERSKKQEQVMKADQRLRVAAEPGAARSGERADDFLLFDCANLAARLVQPVEQPSCISIYHSVLTKLLPQKARRTQSKSGQRVTGASEVESPAWIGGGDRVASHPLHPLHVANVSDHGSRPMTAITATS
jgi:hypothetical protein